LGCDNNRDRKWCIMYRYIVISDCPIEKYAPGEKCYLDAEVCEQLRMAGYLRLEVYFNGEWMAYEEVE
jgi:hypothetical protein